MKKFLLIVMCVGMSFSALAQISTGNSTSKNIRTGNRAEAGNFGLYIGADLEFIKLSVKDDVTVAPLPLVNFKYMASDHLELRIGLDLNKYSQNAKGDLKVDKKTYEVQNKVNHADHAIYPGIAYHFSNRNILDVYVGAELPLGYERYNLTSKWDGDDGYSIKTKTAFNVGLGGFIGLQAYIGNLPIAIGAEYGIFSRLDTGLKYKNVEKASKESDEKITYSFDPASQNLLDMDGTYDKLSARNGSVGSQVRFTISYFFNK